jgi:hypothetical protein
MRKHPEVSVPDAIQKRKTRFVGKKVRCRAGSLRGKRSLRDLYSGFALGLPMVGTKILS